MILLDTHVLVWLDAGSVSLGKRSIEIIDRALAESELAVSAVSFWEVAMLADKGRLDLGMNPELWRRDLLNRGLVEIALDGQIGVQAASLLGFHGDPADRMIVATTLSSASMLITADQKILQWPGLKHKINARG